MLIAAGTAAGVGVVLDQRAQDALRARAHDIAVGDAVAAATALQQPGDGLLRVPAVARSRHLALYVVGFDGTLQSAASSDGVPYTQVPRAHSALAAVEDHQRYVRGTAAGGTVVGLRLPAMNAVLVAYRPRSGVAGEVGVVRREVMPSVVLAGAGGALLGLLLAGFVIRRVRRITGTAAAIEQGDFSRTLETGFRDEIGTLGAIVERMRGRLGESFTALEYERDRLRQVLERLHDGVIAVGGDGRIEFANPTARELAGGATLAPGAAVGEPWPEISVAEVIAEMRAGQEPVERRFHQGDRTLDLVGLPPATSGGSVVLVLTDVSEKERRERAEREFVANAAHELRTPTAAILSSVEILQSGAKDDPAAREQFLGHIQRESIRLSRLSTAMLVLARAQTGAEPIELEAVALAPLLREATNEAGIDAIARPGRLPARPAGGRRRRPRLPAVLEPDLERRQARHRAGRDRGSPRQRPRHHDRRQRRRPRHRRRPPRPRVRPLLPRRRPRSRRLRAGAGHRPRRGDGHGRRRQRPPRRRRHPGAGVAADVGGRVSDAAVLIADDEPALLDAVVYALTQAGFETEAVTSGEQALVRAAARRFDVIILDVMLPGLSGFEVCHHIRRAGDVPIILLTARDAEADRVFGLEAGADDYVTKPFSTRELVSRVRSIVRRRELDASAAARLHTLDRRRARDRPAPAARQRRRHPAGPDAVRVRRAGGAGPGVGTGGQPQVDRAAAVEQ